MSHSSASDGPASTGEPPGGADDVLPLLHHADTQTLQQTVMLLRRLVDSPVAPARREPGDRRDLSLRQAAVRALEMVAQQLQTAATADAMLYCELLSPLFRCAVDGRVLELVDWQRWDIARAGWRRVRLCLAFLLHRNGEWATRQQLEQAIWDQHPVPKDGLARVLMTLKHVLSGGARGDRWMAILEQREAGYRLRPGTFHTDVEMFRRAIAKAEDLEQEGDELGSLAAYETAVRYYQANYLSVFGPPILWGEARRMFPLNSYLIACERLASVAADRDDHARCLHYATLGMQADPSATEFYLLAIPVLRRACRTSEIDALFQRYQRITEEPLEPDDPVLALYTQLRQQRRRS